MSAPAKLAKPWDVNAISERVNYLLDEVKKIPTGSYLPISGGRLTGTLTIGNDVGTNQIDNQDYLGTGTGTDAETGTNLRVNGKIRVLRVPYHNGRNMQWKDKPTNDSNSGIIVHDNSSRRFKCDIKPLHDDFHKILQIEPKTYIRPKHIYLPDEMDLFTNKPEIGYIAEELDDLGLNKLVWYDEDGLPDGINYEKMAVCYFQPLIKELFQRVEVLENQVNGKRKKVKIT